MKERGMYPCEDDYNEPIEYVLKTKKKNDWKFMINDLELGCKI